MKKIITLIILALSLVVTPVSAKSYPDAEIDSIFANTLAFQHRLDTAVCTYIGASVRYKTAITRYNLIKQHKINKKDIPTVLKDISENYEPMFAYFLDGPVLEIPYSVSNSKTYHTVSGNFNDRDSSTLDFNTWYSTKSTSNGCHINLSIRMALYGF